MDKDSNKVGKTEEFKRPNHTDFLSSSELKKLNWSGVRHNSILDQVEIWKCGEIAAYMDVSFAQLHPDALVKLYMDTFDL